ncbi:hypothetical protein, partial [Pseudoxanthomonas taiwanensis]|uniref:hypothetical protein n=1 Tax=Pseudoxanthomonas taiwanensis TaxID=176598 RepID=UPI001B86159E
CRVVAPAGIPWTQVAFVSKKISADAGCAPGLFGQGRTYFLRHRLHGFGQYPSVEEQPVFDPICGQENDGWTGLPFGRGSRTSGDPQEAAFTFSEGVRREL